MATRTWGTSSGSWSDDTKWVEGYVPVEGDDIIFNASSADCELDDLTEWVNSLNMTGYSGTLTFIGNNFRLKATTSGDCIFSGNVVDTAYGGRIYIRPLTGVTVNLYCNGAFDNFKYGGFYMGGDGGTINFMDSLSMSAESVMISGIGMYAGSGILNFDGPENNLANSHRVTCIQPSGMSGFSLMHYYGNSTITLMGTHDDWPSINYIFRGSATSADYGTSTFIITDTTQLVVFNGNGGSFHNLILPENSNGFELVNSSLTYETSFNDITIPSGGKLILPSSKTTNVTSLTAIGTDVKPITIVSNSDGTPATIHSDSKNIICSYLSLQDSAATGDANFFAGHSTNVSGNSGWKFRQPNSHHIRVKSTGPDVISFTANDVEVGEADAS